MLWFLQISCCIQLILCKTIIDKVHVVFSNHLDVGYHRGGVGRTCAWNEGCTIAAVINQYWHTYWPKAIAISEGLQKEFPNRDVNKSITFNHLTFPYMMSLYLDCDKENKMNLKCPTREEKEYVLNGIKNGHLWFNAFPFNSQLEDYDSSLLQFGIQLSFDIMNETQLPKEWHSTVISQRDVPGLPRNAIPTLLENGIRAISVGANGGEPMLIDKESIIFKWLDPNSKQQIFVMYHSGGYGGFELKDALIIEGFNEALVYAWNQDNKGPFDEQKILEIYVELEEKFKVYNVDERHKIEIFSSTFDNYLDALLAFNDKSILDNIPTYSGSIGDRWGFGIQADPFKNAAYRNIMKLRIECLKQDKCSLSSSAFYNFSRLLIKAGEHTWGASINVALDGKDNSTGYNAFYNKDVKQILSSNNSMNNYTQMALTWDEQRDYGINFAVEALSYSNDPNDIELYNDINQVINGRLHNVSAPNLNGFVKVKNESGIFSFCNDRYQMQLNESNGGISMLYDNVKKVHYADGKMDNNLALFWYQALNESLKSTPARISLPNIYITSNLLDVYRKDNKLVIEMNMGDDKMYRDLCENYSCIYRLYNELEFDCDRSLIEMNLNIINKTLTRIPETLFFSFVPHKCTNWTIQSFGGETLLNDVLGTASHNVYFPGIEGNVSCSLMDGKYSFNVHSIDIGLTAWKPVTYENEMAQGMYVWDKGFDVNSSESDGFAFEMWNNMWGTNYPQWYPFHDVDANMTFNFVIDL